MERIKKILSKYRAYGLLVALIGLITFLQIPLVVWCVKDVGMANTILHGMLGLFGLGVFIYAVRTLKDM